MKGRSSAIETASSDILIAYMGKLFIYLPNEMWANILRKFFLMPGSLVLPKAAFPNSERFTIGMGRNWLSIEFR